MGRVSKKLIPGFDYLKGQPVSYTKSEWLGLIKPIIDDGGRRRVENGETFIHTKRDGILLWEIYDNIQISAR